MNTLGKIQRLNASKPAEKLKNDDDWREYILSQEKVNIEPQYLMSIGGIPCIPRGELIGIKGEAKSGKSQLVYYLAACLLAKKGCIAGDSSGYCHALEGGTARILVADTVQSKSSLTRCVRRALNAAGEREDTNCERFNVLCLRDRIVEDRCELIRKAVNTLRPDVVIIDGIRGLIYDTNDLNQCSLVTWFIWSLVAVPGCTVVFVLNDNNAADAGHTPDYLGLDLLDKYSDCFEVKKGNGVFEVNCTESRNIAPPAFSFRINEEGHFEMGGGRRMFSHKICH